MGGLLKTVVLPYFACLHAYAFASIFLMGTKYDFSKTVYPDVTGDDLNALESHLLGATGAFHCAVGFGCVIGVIAEHSHFRGVMTLMELIFWVLDGYDVYKTEVMPFTIHAVNVVIAAIGLLVHSREPGRSSGKAGAFLCSNKMYSNLLVFARCRNLYQGS